MGVQTDNPYASCLTSLEEYGLFYSVQKLNDERTKRMPYSIRIILESLIRNCDNFEVKKEDVEKVLDWLESSRQKKEIQFKPARVLLQDFTGVPAIVDLAAMRDAVAQLKADPALINPQIPTELVVDHSVIVDVSRSREALEKNQEMEFYRNRERFAFLKWGASAFNNMLIVPPGSGIVHQVNLEYLARVVFHDKDSGVLYCDSLVGTDSHTTMIDGLGVVGWGVGGIEAEAVMLGQPISMVLPEVVGFKLINDLPEACTATDLVLTVTQMLRQRGVVGKFVEFFGPGCKNLPLADRATIANMSPEYGATMGFFPADEQTIRYLRASGRDETDVARTEAYLRAQGLFRTYDDTPDPVFSDVLELDLEKVVPCVSGPKRPHDRVPIADLKREFIDNLTAPVSFKGFGYDQSQADVKSAFTYQGKGYEIGHGAVVIAAITSCTNTSNPSVMLGAGLLARNALKLGLTVAPYVKTSLSPGSGVVDDYFKSSGLLSDLEQLGFFTAGFGCMTCIGNSGELDEPVAEAITKNDLCAASVLSGNRNFEGRVHPLTRANYLASPMLVIAYAIAGHVTIDFETEPLQINSKVFLQDIWPSKAEIMELENSCVKPAMFHKAYANITTGNPRWNALEVDTADQYSWAADSTYIHQPPFFTEITMELKAHDPIDNAYCLLNLGDSVTTDHISPAGKIAKDSPAARFLMSRGVTVQDFNSYGSRRGNDQVMSRGTFANIRLINKMLNKAGPLTIHHPTGEVLPVYDAAARYMENGDPLIILAGKEYGSGSSRDWAAKGVLLQGVRCVIAQSFERIHRSNLVGMGVLPCEFINPENADTLGLTGTERFSLDIRGGNLNVGEILKVTTSTGKIFEVRCRLDTDVEVMYFKHKGILRFMIRKLAAKAT